MFSKVNKLEHLLNKLSEELKSTESKQFVANQMLKAEGINLAEGASLTINMTNMIFSIDVVNECIDIVEEMKPYLPNMQNANDLYKCLNHYKNVLITKALRDADGDRQKACKLLGLTDRQIRYQMSKERL